MTQWSNNRFKSHITDCLKSTETIYRRLEKNRKVPTDMLISSLEKIEFEDYYKFHQLTSDISKEIVWSRFNNQDNHLNYSKKLSVVIWLGKTPIGVTTIADTDVPSEKLIYSVAIQEKYRHTWATVVLKHITFSRLAEYGVSNVIYYAFNNNKDTIRHAYKIQNLSD